MKSRLNFYFLTGALIQSLVVAAAWAQIWECNCQVVICGEEIPGCHRMPVHGIGASRQSALDALLRKVGGRSYLALECKRG